MSKRPGSASRDQTQPSEIPTAVIEDNPFSDDSHTMVEDNTLDATPTTGPRGSSDLSERPIDKFRRPTKSEIMQAVDQVNTEAVDMEELVRARASQSNDDLEFEEDDEIE